MSNVFTFEEMDHFPLEFKCYIEKDLNLKASFFRKLNTSGHLQKTIRNVNTMLN